MVASPLATITLPYYNKFRKRTVAPSRFIVHHWASTSMAGRDRLTNPNEEASANYLVYSTGDIAVQVPEEFSAWTSGGPDIDDPSITIEIQNSTGRANRPGARDDDSDSWQITDAAWNAAANLMAEISTRRGWAKPTITSNQLRPHCDFQATACPGGYIRHRLGKLRDAVNSRISGGSSPAQPAGKSISQLADEVIAGVHGNGDARKASLGANYDAVQAEVNRRLL